MKPTSDTENLTYEVPEAGAMLGLNRNAAYAAVRRGDIPSIRIGKLIRVPRAALHRMLEAAGAVEPNRAPVNDPMSLVEGRK
jgi:excisionase family DNA binding protein